MSIKKVNFKVNWVINLEKHKQLLILNQHILCVNFKVWVLKMADKHWINGCIQFFICVFILFG